MTQVFKTLANNHSATCFLNALLREWHEYVIYQSESETYILISLSDAEWIQIPILKFSILGRHHYTGKFFLLTNENRTEINFESFLDRICNKLAENTKLTTEEFQRFKAEVLSSRDNMEQSFKLNTAHFINQDFITSEQALMIGHNFHPTPKSRDKLTLTELRNYAPEFKGEFQLTWLLVDPAITRETYADSFNNANWLMDLFLQDCEQHIQLIRNRMLPIPMHPWQWQWLQQNPTIKDYIQRKQIIPIDSSGHKWAATSSLRTVYRHDCAYMLKFSMNLKLTNSVRVLLNSEVKRGILLHDVLATSKGQAFLNEFPNFHIMTEPAYVCLVDLEGQPIEATIVVCRINPLNKANEKNKYMLATLIQDDPYAGRNLLLRLIENSQIDLSPYQRLKKWFADFLHITIKPLIRAYAKYGIIMEGHQQNLVLALENGFPIEAYFRDCQDHAYSKHGYHLFASEVSGIGNNPNCIAHQNIGCQYFIYQVILNSTFNLITTLAKSNHINEIDLLSDLRDFLESLKGDDIQDYYCLEQLLNNSTLLHKCNFQFALSRVNDNQLPFNPLTFYTQVPNLIRINQYKMTDSHYPNVLYHRYFESINKTVTFRVIDWATDLTMFLAWQHKPRVAKYWQLEKSYEAESYLKQLLAEPFHQPFIIEINHEPAGYGEVYWAAKDRIAEHYDYHDFDRGFHLLIGEDHLLGIDNSTAVFKAVMHYMYLENHQTMRIVTEPDIQNQKFIKYMKIIPGWRLVKEADFPEKRAAIFISQRKDFMLEGVQ